MLCDRWRHARVAAGKHFVTGCERHHGRNFRKTLELIKPAKPLRFAAIRDKFPEMNRQGAERSFRREVRMIKDAVLNDKMMKHSSGKER